jgi:hypothetical protein
MDAREKLAQQIVTSGVLTFRFVALLACLTAIGYLSGGGTSAALTGLGFTVGYLLS